MSAFTGVKGEKLIYLYRKYSARTTGAAAAVAYVSENSKSISANNDAINTKDGVFRTAGTPETTINATAYFKKSDTALEDLKDALLNSDLMEIWEVNLEEAGTASGTYKGTYFQGYVSSFEVTSTAEEWVEASVSFAINGKGAEGDCTVSPSIIDETSYTFADTTQAQA